MSFSKDTKNSLCAFALKNGCCRLSLLYGILLFGNSFERKRIRLITENERTSELVMRILRECFDINGNLYISEKHSGGVRRSSYKVTVSASADLKKIFSSFGYSEDEPLDRMHPELFVCSECVRSFLRGVFLAGGTISDPESESGYRLDITAENDGLIDDLIELLSAYGISPKRASRKTTNVAYFNESEPLEDFLTFIGAGQAALTLMNVKVMREVRNNQNRASNCDVANIGKTTAAAQEIIRMIKLLQSTGRFDTLPDDIKATAKLRFDNPEASLVELASLHEPPISKSGVNHRLAKLKAYIEEMN